MQRRELSKVLLGTAAGALLAARPQTAIACGAPSALDWIIDTRSYGFCEGNSAAANATAITAAIAAARSNRPSNLGGSIVQLPAGDFDVDPFEIPESVTVQGMGIGATRLVCGYSGYFINLGGNKSGVLKYGCGLSDLSIQMTDLNGHAIRLMETAGARVSRVYMEGAIVSGRSCRGLSIDGGDISSFFNHIEDVIANHWQTGFMMQSSGTTETTLNTFTNCTALGDVGSVGAASIGLRVPSVQGSGSVWVGGNFESCGYGVQLESGCKSMTFYGARFEGNTKDVYLQGTTGASAFIGCFLDLVNGVRNDSSAGFDMHSFIGCVNGSSIGVGARLNGENILRAGRTSDRPLVVEAYPGHTTQVAMQLQNSAGTKLFAVNALGEMDKQVFRSGAGSPVGSVTPRFIGEEYLQTSGTVRWFKSTGTASSAWVALN
jgi:hypothetical protein